MRTAASSLFERNARPPMFVPSLLVATLVAVVFGAAPARATSYFNQTFQTNTTLGTYVGTGANQFDDIGSSGTAPTVVNSGGSNILRVTRSSGREAWFTRGAAVATDLSPAPTAMIFKFDFNLSSITSSGTTPATLRIGSGFTTGNSEPSDANTYAKLGIVNNSGSGFQLRDITNSGSPLATNYTTKQTLTWVLNNTAGTLTYQAPDSTSETIAVDKADLWVGTTKVLNDVNVQTGTQTMTDFKFFVGSNSANYEFDNFDIQTLSPTLSLSQTAASCLGNDGTITATFANGTGPYQLKLDGGAFVARTSPFQYTGVAAGTHLVTVQDNVGTQTYKTIVVGTPTAISLSLSQVATSCNAVTDGKITATWSTGTAPFQINIDGGAFVAATSPFTFMNLAAGSHTIILSDVNTCSVTQSLSVTQPAVLALTTISANPCFGATNGIITATFSGGTGAYQTQINGGGFTTSTSPKSFTGLAAGDYVIDVKDANGCTKSTSTITLVQNSALSLALDSQVNLLCNGVSNGSITVSFSGGTGALTTSVDNATTFTAGASPRTFTGLAAGTHIIRVKDSNPNSPCRDSISVTLTQPATAVTLTLTKTDLTCNGVPTGTVTATFSGGTGTIKIGLDGATPVVQSSPFTFTGLTAATHTVVAVDDNSCTNTKTATPTQPSAIALSLSQVPVSCATAADGVITATFSGGTGAFQTDIDGGGFTSATSPRTLSGLAAGSHTVTVKDANGCTTSLAITVGAPGSLNLSLNASDVTCTAGSNGSVTATFSGGTPMPTTLFTQDFQANATLGTYTTGAANMFNDASGASNGVASIITSGPNNLLRLNRTNGGSVWWTRTADFSPTPTALVCKFDYTVSSITTLATLSNILRIGSGFATGAADATDGNTYAKLGLRVDNATGFKIDDITNNTTLPTIYTGTRTITWALNNSPSNADVSYLGPDNAPHGLASDRMDVWVGATRVLAGVAVQTPSGTMTDMRYYGTSNMGVANYDFDNFLITTPTGGLETKIDAGAFSTVASARTFSGLSAGSHTVTLRDGAGCTASQQITVGTNPTLFTIAASAGANGLISPSGSVSVACGTSQAFTITADPCYQVANVLVDGGSVGAATSYTFSNVQANHTIAANFVISSTTITASAGAGGAISPSGAVIVNCNAAQAFTITPDGCHTLADVLVDGVSVGAVATYTFPAVAAPHTIAASFTIIPYTITAFSGSNGVISPNGAVAINCGSSQAFTFTPDSCYQVADVLADGVSVGAVVSYTFSNVVANHTIDVSFVAGNGIITASAGAHGAISPVGPLTINCHADQAYSITPDPCYHVADLVVDGSSVGAVANYTFLNVIANHAIVATFAIDTHTIAASAGANGTISPNGSVVTNCGTDQSFTITSANGYHVADVLVDGGSVGAVASYTFTNVLAAHTIAATFAINVYTLAVATPDGFGTVTLNPAGGSYNHGTSVQLTAVPTTGYHFVTWNATAGGDTTTGTNPLTIIMTRNRSLTATFAINTFTLTVTQTANGSIAPTGPITVDYGTTQAFTITPNANYHINTVTVDGVAQGAIASYTFSNITANHTITATYAINTFAITASAGANGAISPTGTVTVNGGATQSFTVTPNTGYQIADIVVDGSSAGTSSPYTFTNVQTTHTISVSFSIKTYTLAITTVGSGTVTQAPNQATYNHFTPVTLTATPSAGFAFLGWTGDTSATTNPLSLVMKSNRNLVANFVPGTLLLYQDFHFSNTLTDFTIGGTNTGTQTDGRWDSFAFSGSGTTVAITSNALLYTRATGGVESFSRTTDFAGAPTAMIYRFNLQKTASTGTATPAAVLRVGGGFTTGIAADEADASTFGKIGINIGNTSATTYEIRNISAASPVNVAVAGDSIITWVLNKSGAALSYLAPNGTTTSLGNNLMDIWVGRSLPAGFAGVPATTTSAAMTDLKFYWNTNPATLKFDNFNLIAPALAATITASAGAAGSISPNGATVVQTGNSQSYTITPNACFHINDVLVDGVSVGAVSSYTFTNVVTGHTIAASFAADIKTITASAGVNGAISPSGAVAVNCGSNQAFTITPDSCFTVSDVLVDGVSVGAVAAYTFTNVQVAHTIAVSFVAGNPTVTATAGANGSITPSGATVVSCGADQAFTITPNACYHVASVLVDGVSVGAVTSYTITNIKTNRTIAATFAVDTYSIVASAGANGAVTPAGSSVVNCGTNKTYTITPNACFGVADVLADGVSVGAVTTYTFTNVTANHTLSATFASTNYTIVASATGTGTISPSGSIAVNCNASQAFTMSTDACNQLDSLLVDGVSVSPVTTYTFSNVVANHTITAKFKALQKSIAVTQATGGTIAPTTSASTMLVNCGSNQTFTITPDSCYRLVDVLADGLFQGPVTSYTFTNVTTNAHSITAQYTPKTYTIDTNWIGPGTITPNTSGSNSSVTLNCGVTQTFNFNAITCNSIASVRIDGDLMPMATSYTFTNVQANHVISVIFQTGGLTVAASVGAGGAVTPAGSTAVNCHNNLSYAITPDACFAIAGVLVDGVSVGAVSSYTFTDIQTSHTIAATFASTSYTITASAGANGTISPVGAQAVACGVTESFTITPGACFQVADVLVDGVSVGAVTSYAFTNVTANHTIAASFAAASYTIAASAVGGGTITPSGSVVVNCAANQSFTIAANANHHAVDVLVDGVSVGTVTSYTFTNVLAAHTIAATFAADTYSITASAGANGTIAPAGVTVLNLGDSQSYAVTADAHYHIADVLVDGVSVGAVSNYGFTNVSANHTIAASFAINTYTITASAGSNGTISPSGGVSVVDGSSQAFTISPNSCYHIADVLVDGVSVGAVATYTFTNVAANHTIAASFAVDTYTLTASAGSNGGITPSGATSANCGGSQAYTITPNACYNIADVLVDGVSVGAVASYSFTNVTANHTIAASFVVGVQTIAASAGAGGAISPAGSVAVNCGSDQTFTITPDACYHINDVLVDGLFQGPVSSYTFTNVTGNTHTIAATFTFTNYTLAASAGVNGSITPSGSISVGCGGTQAFTISPDACYQIANVLVDGNSVGAVATYTFTNVLANHVISATFVSGSPVITATAGNHGSIAPVGSLPLTCGASQTFTITPDACYAVQEVMVDGGSMGALTSYTFTNVLANHTIAAAFALTTKTVTASAGSGGSIAPAGAVGVPCGAGQGFSILPAACYHVADVLVDGVSVGAVTNYNFGSVTADRTIAASFAVDVETITASAGAHGSITPSGATAVNCGSGQTFTIAANSCYHIADVLVDGVSVGAVASYGFTNITTNHTIAASFAVDVQTVNASAGAHGSITPSGAVAVNCGSDRSFTITPDACYHVADVLVDGSSVGAVTSYNLTSVTANHTIAASFAVDVETITASAGAHGAITPSGAVAVNCGSDQTFTITPDACYHVADILVDGSSVGAVTSYAFTNVTGNHTIAATFVQSALTVTASAGANGSITPSGAVVVNCGDDQTFTIAANSCYHIADVLVDGVSVGAVGSHTITNVTADHMIAASFAVNVQTVTASAGSNGSITPSGAVAVNCGSNQTFTITPAACYHVADVLVDGSSVGAVTSYTLTNVTADHTIAASFAINVQTVTASAGANGSITPSGATSVNCGSDQTFTIAANSCYHIADVLVDGVSVGAVGSYNFTNVTTNHTIAATFAIDVETITASAGANGSITPSGAIAVNCGSGQTFTIAANSCYHIADVLVDGNSVGAVAGYSFTNVTANHTIAASFAIDLKTVTASAGLNGSITPSGAVSVNCGGNQSFTITPAACYHVADVLVDGSSVGAVTSYTLTNVTADHTVAASFVLSTLTVTASAGANGSITPSGAVAVNCGSDQTFTITPNSCYHIADVLVDGVSVGAVASYTLTNVIADHTIAASFAVDVQTVTASAGPNGSITPSGAVAVNCGSNQTFTITPDACYHVADVLVDGGSMGAVTSYTLTNVTADHTIAASFAINVQTITASAGANGSITPSGVNSVNCGSGQSFTIVANSCYHIADVLVDGGSVGAVSSYGFTNVTANHTIAASFAIDVEAITASAGANGSITPSGAIAVNCGGDQAFSIVANSCYHIADVLVDGNSVGAVASYSLTNVTANHTIAATFSVDVQTITASAGANGAITPLGAVAVNCGSNQTFTITPDACYHVADVLVDGGSVGAVTTYSFTSVTSNHTIAASFVLSSLTVTASAGANGSITPSGAVAVGCGSDQTFTITPNSCYHIADVLVDGVSVGAVGSHTITNVTADHTVAASFAVDVQTVTASAGSNGSITPSGATAVNCGSNQAFTITPAACYHVADVLVDGGSVGALTSYTLTNVTADHTIAASFAINVLTVTASAGANGSITPSGATALNCGSSQTYTITPDACYHIVDVLVDGGSVGALASYSFTNVSASHTISASFAVNVETISASAGANGSITPSGATALNCGSDQTFTIAANSCYHIADVLVDGSSVGAVASYGFTNVTTNHTISASFAVDVQTVTASAGLNGSITPSGAVTITCGSNQTFTITPDACYQVADVQVDGGSVGALTSYTLTNVTADRTIAASFVLNSLTIAASAGAHGTITPSGTLAINCGSDQSFSIAADACYHIADVLVDGVSVGAVTSYGFTNVTANHTISASFAIDTYSIATSAGAHGGISPSGTVAVNCGDAQGFTILPAACYHIENVLVDGVSVGAVANYNFATVGANHTLAASFAVDTHVITASAGTHGSISLPGATAIDCGNSRTYMITPDPCSHIVDVLVDGVSVGAVASYSFTNVTTDHTIDASFDVDLETITASAGPNGSITPSGSVGVACGSDQSFVIAANSCYHIADVKVDGNSVGAVTSYSFTNATSNHTIAASFAVDTYTITASAAVNGSVTPSGASVVNCGTSPVYTMTANAGYHVVSVLVDGSPVGAVTSYTFTSVAANRTIAASFAVDAYTITASAGPNGSITPSGAVAVANGGSQTFAITPNAHYHVLDVLVDGVSVGAVTTRSFTNVTANHTIAASFAIDTRTITASAGPNGSITPLGATTVGYGGSQSFVITPAANYHVLDVLVDNVSIGSVTNYPFINVTTNHTIAASFAINTYTIVASSGGNGSITPVGAVTVNHGAGQGFTMTPAGNYHIADVLVDGISVGAVGSYTFTNVTTNHTIAASFAIDTYTITASATGNGSVAPSGVTAVNAGGSQTITITADACYHVADVLVDGNSVGAVASYSFTTVASSHTLVASFAINTYTITASAGTNGSLTPSGATLVNCGGSQGYTIAANAGYHTADVLVDGFSVGAVASYSFTNVSANHTIAATFTIDNYTITASAGANGTISPSGAVPVTGGASQSFSILPAACYSVANVLVDGVSVGAVANYNFANVTANHTISATFVVTTKTITASAGANGTISPLGATAVSCGGTQAYTVTPALHFHVANVLVDGVSAGAITSYTFTNVTAPHTISATFALDQLTITATAGPNGVISPSGSVLVNYGWNRPFTIVPAANYHVATLTVDGAPVAPATSYTFLNVTTNHTIAVTFAINSWTITASAGTGGAITPSGAVLVNQGASPTFTITPATGYNIASLTVDGGAVAVASSYTFTNVTANHTIAVTFALKTLTILATAGPNGVISPSGSVSVNYGWNRPFTIVPAANYHVATLTVDGNAVAPATSYTFTNVTTNHTIAVTFAINGYTITASAGSNGTISPVGAVVVASGAAQTFTLTPAAHYKVATLTVDGGAVAPANSYTFTNVTANHTIAATFTLIQLAITASAGPHGVISPSGAVLVNYGWNRPFSIVPAANYRVATLTVDGSSVPPATSYTFLNVTTNHTIAVTFAKRRFTITASASANGAVAPAGAVEVDSGATHVVTLTPAPNYRVATLTVDGVSVTPANNYTFPNVTADHTVAATFQQLLAVDSVPTVLALAGLRPNPAVGPLNVSFSLPNSEPAKLELLDVTGRVVRAKEVGSLGAGRHLVNLGHNRDLAAGVYWLRLSQGDHAVTSKATVVH